MDKEHGARSGETTADAFLRYQESAASRLRYALANLNLTTLHSLAGSAKVLDAAAGNGLMAERLASQGHSVTLYEMDPEMLQRAGQRLDRSGLLGRCQMVQGSLETIEGTLGGQRFDLILCHHSLEYVAAVPPILAAFRQLSAPRGELSLITLNPVSEVIRSVIFQKDPVAAFQKLADHHYDARWFGQATLYSREKILRWAADAGWTLTDFRGIRALADYIPPSQVNGQREAELLRLEQELAGLDPFRSMARYIQFAFRH